MQNKSTIVILGTCIIAAAGGFYLHKGVNVAPMAALAITEDVSSTPPALSELNSSAQDVTQGKRQYSNKAFHFSLLYPETLQVQEYNEQGGGFTVTFQDIEADQEFQIYVTPYSEEQISGARFKLDEPSGIRNNPTDVVIDGARGTMFFSNAPRMNDTREVWFIKNGYLYEVTTYKELDSWLAQILQTWQFI